MSLAPPSMFRYVLCVTSGCTAIFPRSFRVTLWNRVSLDKLKVADMAMFYYHAHNSHPLVPNHSQVDPGYVFHPHLHLNLGVGLYAGTFKQVSNQNFVIIFSLPLECHMSSRSYHSFLFRYTNGILRGIQINIQICLLFIIRNNFHTTQSKSGRATPCLLWTTV